MDSTKKEEIMTSICVSLSHISVGNPTKYNFYDFGVCKYLASFDVRTLRSFEEKLNELCKRAER